MGENLVIKRSAQYVVEDITKGGVIGCNLLWRYRRRNKQNKTTTRIYIMQNKNENEKKEKKQKKNNKSNVAS